MRNRSNAAVADLASPSVVQSDAAPSIAVPSDTGHSSVGAAVAGLASPSVI